MAALANTSPVDELTQRYTRLRVEYRWLTSAPFPNEDAIRQAWQDLKAVQEEILAAQASAAQSGCS